MKTISEYIAFVNEQIAFHKARVEMYDKHKSRKIKHMQTFEEFVGLKKLLEQYEKQEAFKPEQLSLNLRPEDIEGLPKELIEELSITSADKAEFRIMALLEAAGGVLSLDQILVQFYKETGEIVKRAAMTNRMYRMVQKGLVYSVPQKKGAYSLTKIDKEMTEEEVLLSYDPADDTTFSQTLLNKDNQ